MQVTAKNHSGGYPQNIALWEADLGHWEHNGGPKMSIFAALEALWAPTWNHLGFILEFVRWLDQVNAQGLAAGGSTGHQQSLLYLRRGPI